MCVAICICLCCVFKHVCVQACVCVQPAIMVDFILVYSPGVTSARTAYYQ